MRRGILRFLDEKTEQNLKLIKDGSQQEARGKEVLEQRQPSLQTNPLQRKLLDFSLANKTRRFSVRDLLKR